jgi:hypothetical protein
MTCHCGKKAVGRGLCAYHYQVAKRKGQLPELQPKRCARCGGEWYCHNLCKSCYEASGDRCRVREWRAEHREPARKIKAKSKKKRIVETKTVDEKFAATIPKPVKNIRAFGRAPCGREYDPVACPLRHRSGLVEECKNCIIFTGGNNNG